VHKSHLMQYSHVSKHSGYGYQRAHENRANLVSLVTYDTLNYEAYSESNPPFIVGN
jgi:hypothetical protein